MLKTDIFFKYANNLCRWVCVSRAVEVKALTHEKVMYFCACVYFRRGTLVREVFLNEIVLHVRLPRTLGRLPV